MDPHERLLRRDGKPVPLTPKVFDLLLLLVENKGRLLEKEDLMQALWQDSFVEESNLSFSISTLRKALGEDPKQRQYIETVPKRGYRFIADVKIVEEEVTNPLETSKAPPIQTFPEKEDHIHIEKNEAPESDVTVLSAAVENGAKFIDKTSENFTYEDQSKPQISRANHWLKIAALAFIFVLAAVVSFGIYKFTSEPSPATSNAVSPPMKITRLTTARNAIYAAISPDGKYVAYVVDEARQRSLWLRQITTNSDTQLIPPADVSYLDVIFSSDGSYINYFKAEPDSPPALYQIPILGGTPRKLIEDAPSPALSPDGKQFAFTKQSGDGEVELWVANAFDGSGGQKLITRKKPGFLFSPNWSPDGKTIVCIAGNVTETGRQANLIEIRVEDKTERTLTSEQWKFIKQLAFLPDKSGIIATVSDYPFGPYQVWHVSYPDGKARRVTNDLSNYGNISVTADSKSVVTVQSDIRPFVWVLPGTETAKASQITSSPGTVNDYWGFSWTPDGRIVYVSTSGGNHNIWIMKSDGTEQKQLTFGEHSNFDPSVSPDGRHIVFASERSGITKIWQMDINGENLKQLTRGDTSDFLPFHTPDGRAVIYTSSDTRNATLWKVALGENSAPVQLTRYDATWGSVSPDGTLIASWHFNEQKRAVELIVLPSEGGDPIKSFNVSPTTKTWSNIHWTSDGRALTYIDTIGGVGNIWIQQLDGGLPRQLTDFKTERVFRFAWSRDGKQLALSRGVETNDVVLISNFR
ncbi:MAG: winged helix-turn-helix domain-containing protein [Acidobacteriota bacterium]|nr:winged helix-turn-helix domain-containing protein [Acidobacteriota bacterium]MDQ4123042.1 winged helix-turn-helix domain-containing protein [Acidobacteriota bacterium]